MASNDLIKGAVIVIAVGGGWLYSAWRRRKRARQIADTPRSKLASAPQGFVEVEGFAWCNGDRHFKSVSGKPVVYYDFQLQRLETKGSGKNKRKEWVTVFRKTHEELFYICDATGLAMVEPQSAEFNLYSPRITAWNKLGADEKDRICSEIVTTDIHGFPPATGFFKIFAGSYRIVEKEIRLGSPLYVAGNLVALSDTNLTTTEPGLTKFARQVLDFQSRSTKNVDVILDKDRDGKVSRIEALNGYSQAAHFAREQAMLQRPEEQAFDIFGMMQTNENHKLFIADQHEAHLVAHLLRFNKTQIAAAGTCLAVGFSMLLSVFIGWESVIRMPKFGSREYVSQAVSLNVPSSLEISALHQACTKNVAHACSDILAMQSQLQLSPEHLVYYRKQACRHGDSAHCNPHVPASASDRNQN